MKNLCTNKHSIITWVAEFKENTETIKILDYKHINIDWLKENKTGRAIDGKGKQSQNE